MKLKSVDRSGRAFWKSLSSWDFVIQIQDSYDSNSYQIRSVNSKFIKAFKVSFNEVTVNEYQINNLLRLDQIKPDGKQYKPGGKQ